MTDLKAAYRQANELERVRKDDMDELVKIFASSFPGQEDRVRLIMRSAYMRGAWAGCLYNATDIAALQNWDTGELLTELEQNRATQQVSQ